jgi:hypothetical protein
MAITSRLTNTGILLVNGALDEASLPAGAISFNGTSQYLSTPVTIPINTLFDLVATDFTIEGWFYNAGAGAERYIVSQRGAGSGWEFRINATNLLQFFYTGGSQLISTGTVPANTWTYIAVTRSGATVRIFINGALDSSTTFSNGSSAASVYPLYIGWGTTGGGYFSGYISNLRIIKGTAVYTAAFTPPQSILPSITNTQLLLNVTDSANFIKDNSPNNLTLTNNGTATWTATGPFNRGSTTLKQRQLSDGTLEVLTQFDEVTNMIITNGLLLYVNGTTGVYSGTGTQWSDLSSYNNNATLTNSPTYSASTGGGSFAFDGSTQYAPITTALLNTTYTGKTVFIVGRMNASAWTPGVGQYRAMYGTASGTRNFNFYVFHDGANLFYFHYSTPGSAILTGSVALTTGTWFIVAVTQDATTTTVYLNGTLIYSVGGQTLNQYAASGQEAVAKADNYWYGDIAVCALYSRALSAAEVLNNYNAFASRVGLSTSTITKRESSSGTLYVNNQFDEFTGAPVVDSSLQLWVDAGQTASYPGSGTTWTDLSTNALNGTLVNSPTFSTNPANILFNGTSQRVTFAANSAVQFLNTSSYTLDVWVYPTQIPPTQTYQGLIDR